MYYAYVLFCKLPHRPEPMRGNIFVSVVFWGVIVIMDIYKYKHIKNLLIYIHTYAHTHQCGPHVRGDGAAHGRPPPALRLPHLRAQPGQAAGAATQARNILQ